MRKLMFILFGTVLPQLCVNSFAPDPLYYNTQYKCQLSDDAFSFYNKILIVEKSLLDIEEIINFIELNANLFCKDDNSEFFLRNLKHISKSLKDAKKSLGIECEFE